MAIMHLSTKIIKRSQGRNAVAAAAYRSCSKLIDERQDMVFDYTKKTDLVREEVFIPIGAPSRLKNREVLWNEVEQTENRKDSRLSREIEVAVPKELTYDQNWSLITEYVNQYFVSQGMVADVCFHAGHGNEQPHAHVMLSLRQVTQDGFGLSARHWNQRELVTVWRQGWAELCNHHLAIHGHDVRIDHRSHEERGIDLIPQNKIGVSATRAKREKAKGIPITPSDRVAEHNTIARSNGDRIIANPSIALHLLSQQQSTFSDKDIARIANRYSIDAEQFTLVYQTILQSKELVSLGKNTQHEMRYTSQELLDIETQLIQSVTGMAEKNKHKVSAYLSDKAIRSKTLSDTQADVLKAIVHGGDVVGVVGFAGTGKTHLLGAAREAWDKAGYRVRGLALAGRAADGLLQDANIESRTIASHLLAWRDDRERLSKKDILVIDEAGMVDSRLLADVMGFAKDAGAKVVLVGDHTQLQPIGAGAAFRAILERIGFVSLTEVRRQEADWMREASKDLALGRTREALLAYGDKGHVHDYATHGCAVEGAVDSWWAKRQLSPGAAGTLSAFMRKDVASLNELARQKLRDAKQLGRDIEITIDDGHNIIKRNFAKGDEIYFLKNEKGLGVTGVDDTPFGVKNGTRGIIKTVTKDQLTVEIAGDKPRKITFDVKNYNYFDYAYAATVHKLQGATFSYNDYLPSYNGNRYLSHVALTRHKVSCDIHWSKESFHHGYYSLSASMARESVKDFTLDYRSPRGLESPLTDVDRVLVSQGQTKALDAWIADADVSELSTQSQPELVSLLNVKQQLDMAFKQRSAEGQAYEQAEESLIMSISNLKVLHQSSGILNNCPPSVVNLFTEHRSLNALEKGAEQMRPVIPKVFNANLDTHLDKVLSSFDWHSIEREKDKHPAIAALAEAKTSYESIKAAAVIIQKDHGEDISSIALEDSVRQHENAVKKTLRHIVDDKSIYQEVIDCSSSLVEPLSDIKGRSDKNNQLDTSPMSPDSNQAVFEKWVASVDWDSIKKLNHNHTYVKGIVDAVDGYKKAIANDKKKLSSLYRQRAEKMCARTAKSKILQEQVNKLNPIFSSQVKILAKSHSIQQGLDLSQSQEFEL